MFNRLDRGDLAFEVLIVLKKGDQLQGSLVQVFSLFAEEVVERLVAW